MGLDSLALTGEMGVSPFSCYRASVSQLLFQTTGATLTKAACEMAHNEGGKAIANHSCYINPFAAVLSRLGGSQKLPLYSIVVQLITAAKIASSVNSGYFCIFNSIEGALFSVWQNDGEH